MVLGLFDPHTTLALVGFGRCRRIPLHGMAFLDHVPGYLQGDAQLFEQLREGLHWHAAERQMYERTVRVPRLLAGLPQDGPVHPVLAEVSAALGARYGRPVDRISSRSTATAATRSRSTATAWVIRSRTVWSRPSRSAVRGACGSAPSAFDLGYGDLLVMGGSCQRDYEQGVPKVAHAPPRMSVMFCSS
jgi:hypothetical protein